MTEFFGTEEATKWRRIMSYSEIPLDPPSK